MNAKHAKELSKLYSRACLWETRSKRASLKGDHDRAGRNRTKSLQIMAKARRIENSAHEALKAIRGN